MSGILQRVHISTTLNSGNNTEEIKLNKPNITFESTAMFFRSTCLFKPDNIARRTSACRKLQKHKKALRYAQWTQLLNMTYSTNAILVDNTFGWCKASQILESETEAGISKFPSNILQISKTASSFLDCTLVSYTEKNGPTKH